MKHRSNFGFEAKLSDEDIRFKAVWHQLEVYNDICVVL